MSKPSRREFLSTAAAGAASLGIASQATASMRSSLGTAKSCIFINMVGGPAHLDTFDPKPDAPLSVRGPFKPIKTKVPGLHLSELFPKLAGLTDKFSLVRSMHHTAPPIHEAGFQLLNTGRLFRDGPEWPNVGAVMGYLKGDTKATVFPPTHIICPTSEIETGIRIGHGFGNGYLEWRVPSIPSIGFRNDVGFELLRRQFGLRVPSVLGSGFPNDALFEEQRKISGWECDERYGLTAFGQNCFGACDGIAKFPGRFITINQFSTVFDSPSWDCHADGGSLRTDLNDIRDTVAPSFDAAFAALITGLEDRGLLESTLVVATGEFGRTPLLNGNGGRDHWAGAWTALVAGGGTQGGRIIGRTDAKGTEPTDRPVTPQELVSMIFHAMGVPHDATIPGPDGKPVAVYPGMPVRELF